MPRSRPGLLAYRLANGEETYLPLDQDETTIGRSESCTVVISASTVSRLHARIELQHDRYVLFDAGSANGTFLNGELISDGQQLSTNNEIWLGSPDVALSFSDPDETLGVALSAGAPLLFIDTAARTVHIYGVPAPMTALEYELLCYLAQRPRRVCTREECFLAVWGLPYDHRTCEHALNACIARLRRSLRTAAEQVGQDPPLITTIKRIGFRLDSQATFDAPARRLAALQERAAGV
jgi:DNA-binding winged helix-turn-helix (wHTH) protein